MAYMYCQSGWGYLVASIRQVQRISPRFQNRVRETVTLGEEEKKITIPRFPPGGGSGLGSCIIHGNFHEAAHDRRCSCMQGSPLLGLLDPWFEHGGRGWLGFRLMLRLLGEFVTGECYKERSVAGWMVMRSQTERRR